MRSRERPMPEWARAYAERGWHVLPCRSAGENGCSCGHPDCKKPGKHPWTKNGLKNASADADRVARLWKGKQHANVAIRTGRDSGLVVIDIDPRNGGVEAFAELEEELGPLPATLEVATGGGGRHLYFKHPGGTVKSRPMVSGIDVKADGGYVIAPPSRHVSGKTYEWTNHEDSLAELPAEWLERIRRRESKSVSSAAQVCDEPIPEGRRNTTLTSMAGSMRRRGFPAEAIEAALLVVNEKRCVPPLEAEEVRRIAESISAYPPAESRPIGGEEFDVSLEFAAGAHARTRASLDREQGGNPAATNSILGALDESPRLVTSERFRITSPRGLLHLPPPEYLVEGILPRDGLGLIIGDWGSGKSFLAVSLACAVATGISFLGRKVNEKGPFRVLYVCCEGQRAFPYRIEAWATQHPDVATELNERLEVLHSPAPQLHKEEHLVELLRVVTEGEFDLVIIDTLARVAVEIDENSPKEMGHVVRAAEELRAAGATVLIVHHVSKADGSTPRGATNLPAAIDAILLTKKPKDSTLVTITCQKAKDDEVFKPIKARITRVEFEWLPGRSSAYLAEEKAPKSSRTLLSADELSVVTARRKWSGKSSPNSTALWKSAKLKKTKGSAAIKSLKEKKILTNVGKGGRPLWDLDEEEFTKSSQSGHATT